MQDLHFCVLVILLGTAKGTIKLTTKKQNKTFSQTFESQPALFGKYISQHVVITSNLSQVPGNNFLCGGVTANDSSGNFNGDMGLKTLIAERGKCSFEDKARFAQDYSPEVEALIVYDNEDSPDDYGQTLIAMGADNPNGVNIQLLFVSKSTGLEMTNKTVKVNKFEYDGVPPPDVESIYLSSWYLILICSIFTLGLGCSGIVFCLRRGLVRNNEGLIIIGQSSLLTDEAFRKFEEVEYGEDPSMSMVASHDEIEVEIDGNRRNPYYATAVCSICLETYELKDTLTMLPCRHAFHPGCIKPWVTQRSSSCPLCKRPCQKTTADNDVDAVYSSNESNSPENRYLTEPLIDNNNIA